MSSFAQSALAAALNFLDTLKERKAYVLAVLAAYFVWRRLRRLMRARHSILYRLVEALPPSPALFPQYFLSEQGLWLHWRKWPVASPAAAVFVCHGFGEHVGRYEHVAAAFNAAGYSVYALDHQGHGLSEGDRAHVERFEHYAIDFLQFVRHVQTTEFKNAKPVPAFLLGHSMGGAIAVQVARRSRAIIRADGKTQEKTVVLAGDKADLTGLCDADDTPKSAPASAAASPNASTTSLAAAAAAAATATPSHTTKDKAKDEKKKPSTGALIWPWSGVILSAPLVVPDPNVATPLMKRIARFASRFLPKLSPQKIDAGAVSRYHAVVERYRSDPLVYHGAIRARWGWEVIAMADELKKNIDKVAFPFLAVHGTADRLVACESSEFLHKKAASVDKTLKLYKGAYHELFNDLGHEQVTADVLAWVKERL